MRAFCFAVVLIAVSATPSAAADTMAEWMSWEPGYKYGYIVGFIIGNVAPMDESPDSLRWKRTLWECTKDTPGGILTNIVEDYARESAENMSREPVLVIIDAFTDYCDFGVPFDEVRRPLDAVRQP